MATTKEQQRSGFALEKIEKVFGGQTDKDTANFIVGLPTMILQNGFGQTLAFLFSKWNGKNDQKHMKYKKCADIMLDWANKNSAGLGDELMGALTRISKMDAHVYLKIQQETLAMLGWLKRYARAFQKEA